MAAPPPPDPTEYDPETGTYRARRFTSPGNMLWGVVFAVVVVGLFDPLTWSSWVLIGAGVLLAAILVAVDRRSTRRRRRREGRAGPM